MFHTGTLSRKGHASDEDNNSIPVGIRKAVTLTSDKSAKLPSVAQGMALAEPTKRRKKLRSSRESFSSALDPDMRVASPTPSSSSDVPIAAKGRPKSNRPQQLHVQVSCNKCAEGGRPDAAKHNEFDCPYAKRSSRRGGTSTATTLNAGNASQQLPSSITSPQSSSISEHPPPPPSVQQPAQENPPASISELRERIESHGHKIGEPEKRMAAIKYQQLLKESLDVTGGESRDGGNVLLPIPLTYWLEVYIAGMLEER